MQLLRFASKLAKNMHKNILVKAIFQSYRRDDATAAMVRCGFIVFAKCCTQYKNA